MHRRLDELLKTERIIVPDQAGSDLCIEHVPRQLPGVLKAQGEVLLSGVDNRLDLLIADQAPKIVEVLLLNIGPLKLIVYPYFTTCHSSWQIFLSTFV